MQLQTADPHDAIAAQLRGLAPRRAPDAPEPDDPPAASPEPASEPSLRATPVNDNAGEIRVPPPRGRSGPVVVLLAVCAGIAGTMAWQSYGDDAKQRLSHLVPQLLAYVPMMPGINAGPKDAQAETSQTAAAQPATDATPAQETNNAEPATPKPSASATPSASASATLSAPAPAAPAAETPPAQAALPSELMQSIEAMTRDIASLKQTVEQLQAGQQQLSHDVAKIDEHGTRHKAAERTPKPASRPRRAPASAVDSRASTRYSPPQAPSQRLATPRGAVQHDAYIPPPAPPRLPPPPGDSSAPRPPMPLR
jgi:hypothetical protein